MTTTPAVSVVGLGKLGAPLAGVLAAKGHRVVGVDVNPRAVALLNDGKATVQEPGLSELIAGARDRLTATTDIAAAVRETDATFIIVPTPSEDSGAFSLRYALAAAESVGRALSAKDAYHLVVLTSTVMPGSTGGQVMPTLERHSGKRCGVDFGLCYSPQFIALGTVLRDMTHPDLVLIGASDARAGERLAAIYAGLCENSPQVARMNFVNAELTKLALNTFVTTKISYANMLAAICEQLPGADVDVVTAALGSDSRIGRKYLKGALGYGGPCFPRDNSAFACMARRLDAPATLAEATDEINRQQVGRLARLTSRHLPDGGRVGIWGLSYKPDTDVIEWSPGLELARRLLAEGVPVVVYDPFAMENARLALGDGAVFAGSARECAGQADVLVVTTPWKEFASCAPPPPRDGRGRPTVIDCWRILDRREWEAVADYVSLGTGPQE